MAKQSGRRDSVRLQVTPPGRAFEVQALERRVLMCADEHAAALATAALERLDAASAAGTQADWHVTHSKAEHFPGSNKDKKDKGADAGAGGDLVVPVGSGIGTGTTGGTSGSGPQGFATRAGDGLPLLNSRPDAFANLLLDFDGGLWQDKYYRPFGADDVDASFNATEQASVVEMWRRVSEAFSPFNVNVTTVDPGNQFDRQTATIIMAGHAGGGGWGYVGGFYNGAPNRLHGLRVPRPRPLR